MESRISIITLGVQSMRISIRFYRDGLKFSTDAKDEAEWAIFRTAGTRLSLYSKEGLAKDIGIPFDGTGFGGITLAHNVPSREDVDQIIQQAVAAGGSLLKSPCEAEWGGYSGYFADPDGYPWEVACGDGWEFGEDGTLWGGSLGPMPRPNAKDGGDA